jgi:peptidoglycan/LPS O-acetylase OafA/YrhL
MAEASPLRAGKASAGGAAADVAHSADHRFRKVIRAPMDPAAAPYNASRLPGLDLLRAVAISWVMIYHASGFGLVSQHPWVVKFGWMGVDLFFVLSGFLIAGQLLKAQANGAPDYPRFFARRLLRTLPAFLVVLAVYALVPAARDRPTLLPLWRFLTFTQNIDLHVDPPKAFSHAWSLCVEEQFYLALPLVLMLLARRASAARTTALIAALVLMGMALRGWFWLHDVAAQPFDLAAAPQAGRYMRLIYYPSWTRLDGLLAGVGLAAVRTFRPAWWARLTSRPNWLLIAGVAAVVAATQFFGGQTAGFWPTVFGFPMVALGMGLMVAAGAEAGSLIGSRAVPGAGALAAGAYSLYLSHKIVFHAVQVAGAAWPRSLALAAALLAALVVGAALYWGVERPFLRLRDRGRAAPARPVEASATA